MNKKPALTCFPLLALLLISGCYQFTLQSARNTPVQFNQAEILKGHKVKVIRHFYREQQLNYVFGINDQEAGLLNRILNEEANEKQMVINLDVRRTYNALDVAVSLFTLGIYSRAWIIIEGDIIAP